MKSTGVVRKLDNLGRIVIPIELRKTMGIAIKDTNSPSLHPLPLITSGFPNEIFIPIFQLS